MNLNPKVTEYIEKSTSDQVIILETLRTLIHETVTNVSEEIKWNMPLFNNREDFAYLRFAKKHITLGFYNIDKIQDSAKIIQIKVFYHENQSEKLIFEQGNVFT